MKKYILILVLLLAVAITKVDAATFHEYYPGGKNYINPENVTIDSYGMKLKNNIKVKKDTYYTLTFPGFDYYDSPSILIYGKDLYFDDSPDTFTECNIDTDITSCTFLVVDDYLYIEISSPSAQMYYDHYQLENIQFEEGQVSTTYEPYIAPLVDTDSPTFSGSGGFITSYSEITSIDSIISNHIVAVDEVDGDLSHRIVVETDEYTGNEQVVGEYNVLLSVTDNSNNTATFNLTILVKDQINPIIECADVINVDVNDKTSINTIISNNIIYSDEYDQNPQLTILFDGYTGNEDQLGSYPLELRVEDTYGNQTTKQVSIVVNDYEKPMITTSLFIDENVNNPRLVQDIIADIVITDNYDINPSVTIINDDYTANNSLVGTYFVEIEVSDFSGNTNAYTLEINVKDQDFPVIDGPDTISFSYQDLKTLEEIINMYTVTDNFTSLTKEDIYIKIDEYTNRESTVGEYQVILGIKDGSNNETTKTITITVFDDVVPLIFVDEYIIVLEQGSSFSQEDAMKLLLHNKELEDKEYQILVLHDEYTGNEEVEGRYIYELRFTDYEGNIYDKEFIVEVQESAEYNQNDYRIYVTSGVIICFSLFVIFKKKK